MTADSPRPADLLELFPEHSSVTPGGELVIGGVGARDLAERFGTPAYIVDEAGLRNQARRMRDGLATRHPDFEANTTSESGWRAARPSRIRRAWFRRPASSTM